MVSSIENLSLTKMLASNMSLLGPEILGFFYFPEACKRIILESDLITE